MVRGKMQGFASALRDEEKQQDYTSSSLHASEDKDQFGYETCASLFTK